MAKESTSTEDTITIENILEEISSFDATYAELLRNLANKTIYKQLKGFSELQFFSATESSLSDEEDSRRIRMQFLEIELLATSALNTIDDVISEKFQSNFLGQLKEEVLKIILKLYSDQAKISSEGKNVQASQPAQNSTEGERNEKDMNKNSENSLHHSKDSTDNGLSKHLNKDLHSEATNENTARHIENIESILSTIKREEDEDFGNLSFGSVSSVHTSDLSSFNDDISMPSDEETGKKGKRMSFKMAEEELIKAKAKRLKDENEKEEHSSEVISDPEKRTEDSSKVQKSLPQRVRKPNSKYSEFVPTSALSPIKQKFVEKSTHSKILSPVQNPKTLPQTGESASRKRGRPKKIP